MPNKLTKNDAEKIAQVAVTMRIENMPLSKQTYRNMIDVATGKKTEEEIAAEIRSRYTETKLHTERRTSS